MVYNVQLTEKDFTTDRNKYYENVGPEDIINKLIFDISKIIIRYNGEPYALQAYFNIIKPIDYEYFFTPLFNAFISKNIIDEWELRVYVNNDIININWKAKYK